jgi:hypothetical protein
MTPRDARNPNIRIATNPGFKPLFALHYFRRQQREAICPRLIAPLAQAELAIFAAELGKLHRGALAVRCCEAKAQTVAPLTRT